MTRNADSAPHELTQLQAQFTRALRTPLRTHTGVLEVDRSLHDPQLVASMVDGESATASDRLSVYQRQYWFRLFGAMQSALPLSARLIGMFRFNQIAQAYLIAHAPRHHDLGRIADNFESWLAITPSVFASLKQHGVNVPKSALMQSVALDYAWQRVWMTPRAQVWKPSADEAESLAGACLIAAPSVALLTEDWPLLELRTHLSEHLEHDQMALPKRLAKPRHWALVRTDKGIGHVRLHDKQVQLYRACLTLPIDAAIARVTSGASRKEQLELTAQVQAWFAQSMEFGLWSGVKTP